MQVSTSRNGLLIVISALGLLLIWKLAAVAVGKEIILPDPAIAWRALVRLATDPKTWTDVSATLVRGLVGFSLSYLAGLGFGLACGLSRVFNALFRPLLVGIRSTPSMALILLALIWFRSDTVAIFVTLLVVFPLVTQNVTEGIQSIDPLLLEMAAVYRVKRTRVLAQLCLPAILPYLAAGATAGLGLTWKVMISAEVLASPRWGIGARMDNARAFLNTPEVFAWTAVVILLGLLFDQALETLVRRKLLFWR